MKTLILLIISYLVVGGYAKKDCSKLQTKLEEVRKITKQTTTDIIDNVYPYHKDLETLMNIHISSEMNAFYTYLSMANFFGTEMNDLEGFYAYFHAAAMEEFKHAQMFMKYQSTRGGRNHLYSLDEPTVQTWTNGRSVLEAALVLETEITEQTLCLHKIAQSIIYNDVDLVNFLETDVIPEQFTSMKELKSHIESIERLANGKNYGSPQGCTIQTGGCPGKNYGLAEFEYDKKFREIYKK